MLVRRSVAPLYDVVVDGGQNGGERQDGYGSMEEAHFGMKIKGRKGDCRRCSQADSGGEPCGIKGASDLVVGSPEGCDCKGDHCSSAGEVGAVEARIITGDICDDEHSKRQ